MNSWHGKNLRLSRRTFLLAAGAVSLAGCSVDPRINTSGAKPKDTPKPVLDEARANIAAKTLRVRNTAAAIANLPECNAVEFFNALAAQQDAYLITLLQENPLSGLQGDHTAIDRAAELDIDDLKDYATSLITLAGYESELAADLLKCALNGAATDSMALYWISQYISANCYASALTGDLGPAPEASDQIPAQLPDAEPGKAWQILLAHQRALVYGIQEICGTIEYTEPAYRDMQQLLNQEMLNRDNIIAQMSTENVADDGSLAAYPLPDEPNDPNARACLLGKLQRSLMSSWASLAAREFVVRQYGIDKAIEYANLTRSQQIALSYWPGWS